MPAGAYPWTPKWLPRRRGIGRLRRTPSRARDTARGHKDGQNSLSGGRRGGRGGSEGQKDAASAGAAQKSKIELSAAEKFQAGRELALDDLVDLALENNTATRIYWFQAKSYAAQKGSAMAAYYPQVSVGAQVYRSKIRPSLGYGGSSIPIGTYYETGFGPSAEINWMLFDFGKREAQVESAQNALLAANFDYNQTIQDVVLNVAVAYYDFYSACGNVESAKLSLDEARTAYESAKARLDQSVGNKQDMLNALANAKNAEFVLEQARSSVETARANLAQVLGVRVGPNFVVSAEAVVPSSPETSKKIDELVAKAMRSRQTLLAAYARLAKSASDVKTAERDFLPQIGAFGQFSYTDYTDDSRGHQDTYTGGFSLSWSIFEGFARKYALLNARAAERAQAQQLKAAEIQIISDVWNYYHKYSSSVKQVASATAAARGERRGVHATKFATKTALAITPNFERPEPPRHGAPAEGFGGGVALGFDSAARARDRGRLPPTFPATKSSRRFKSRRASRVKIRLCAAREPGRLFISCLPPALR